MDTHLCIRPEHVLVPTDTVALPWPRLCVFNSGTTTKLMKEVITPGKRPGPQLSLDALEAHSSVSLPGNALVICDPRQLHLESLSGYSGSVVHMPPLICDPAH